jgi:hypothetical protein
VVNVDPGVQFGSQGVGLLLDHGKSREVVEPEVHRVEGKGAQGAVGGWFKPCVVDGQDLDEGQTRVPTPSAEGGQVGKLSDSPGMSAPER